MHRFFKKLGKKKRKKEITKHDFQSILIFIKTFINKLYAISLIKSKMTKLDMGYGINLDFGKNILLITLLIYYIHSLN